jgi:hypothetical protein
MQVSPNLIFGLALLVFALNLVPSKFRHPWIQRLTSWKLLIGLVAVIVATVIVMTPEFYALGILGDSAFFDLLVLAISFQLCGIGARVWRYAVLGFSQIRRFMGLRLNLAYTTLFFVSTELFSTIQKVAHRISS